MGCLVAQDTIDGNFSADPLFCNPDAGDFTLAADSPCLPGQHPHGDDCGLIGALGQGCASSTEVPDPSVLPTTWGVVKSLFDLRGE